MEAVDNILVTERKEMNKKKMYALSFFIENSQLSA